MYKITRGHVFCPPRKNIADSKVPGVETDRDGYAVSAFCKTCQTITSFDPRPNPVIINVEAEIDDTIYRRELFHLMCCARCGRGAVANFVDKGSAFNALLTDFAPLAVRHTVFTFKIPDEISAEFREAELCASLGANRAAAALYRSTLEKTLKANGYRREVNPKVNNLFAGIDAACADNLISEARKRRAHESVRIVGNDVLHDEWRKVENDEVERAHRYTQRILEDFYDDREAVLDALIKAKRLTQEQATAEARPEP